MCFCARKGYRGHGQEEADVSGSEDKAIALLWRQDNRGPPVAIEGVLSILALAKKSWRKSSQPLAIRRQALYNTYIVAKNERLFYLWYQRTGT